MEEEEVLVGSGEINSKYDDILACVWCNVLRGGYEADTFIPFCTVEHQRAYHDFLSEELTVDVLLSLSQINTTIKLDMKQKPIGQRSTEAFRDVKQYYTGLVAVYGEHRARELAHLLRLNQVPLPYTKRIRSAEEVLVFKIYHASADALRLLRERYRRFIEVLQRGGSA